MGGSFWHDHSCNRSRPRASGICACAGTLLGVLSKTWDGRSRRVPQPAIQLHSKPRPADGAPARGLGREFLEPGSRPEVLRRSSRKSAVWRLWELVPRNPRGGVIAWIILESRMVVVWTRPAIRASSLGSISTPRSGGWASVLSTELPNSPFSALRHRIKREDALGIVSGTEFRDHAIAINATSYQLFETACERAASKGGCALQHRPGHDPPSSSALRPPGPEGRCPEATTAS
jgi:hypothetical protein